MSEQESAVELLPCNTSTMHQPEEVDGVLNFDRFNNVPGDCKFAAEAITRLGLPDKMIQQCPELLEKYKAMGAPREAICIAQLMLYAAATSD